jgi:hypothetical protein
MDPFTKAVYVLRCYYGAAIETGADLRAQFRSAISESGKALGLVLVLAGLLLGGAVHADGSEGASGTGAASVSAAQLDEAIGEVMQHREYSWRLPRVAPVQEVERGVIGNFLADALEQVREWARQVGKGVRDFWGWIREWIEDHLFPEVDGPRMPSVGSWVLSVRGLAIALLVVALVALAVLLVRVWKQRANREPLVEAEPVVTAEDLQEERLTADALPEERWLAMAQELIQQGELRLALRAYFLGSLACLSRHELVSIRRFKSNHDYQRELDRRGHAYPALVGAFGANVALFEGVWYGAHDVTPRIIDEFRGNQERIRGGAGDVPAETLAGAPVHAKPDDAAGAGVNAGPERTTRPDGEGQGDAHA